MSLLPLQNTAAFTKNDHRSKSCGLPYITLPQGLFSDGWSPSHTAFHSFETFNLTFLSQTRRSQNQHDNMPLITVSNKHRWSALAPLVLGELRRLRSGFVYVPTHTPHHHKFRSQAFFFNRVYCAYLEQNVFVDGGVFALLADNERADAWANTSSSCSLFCRFGQCHREKDLYCPSWPRRWENTKEIVKHISILKERDEKTEIKKVTHSTGVSSSGVVLDELFLDPHLLVSLSLSLFLWWWWCAYCLILLYLNFKGCPCRTPPYLTAGHFGVCTQVHSGEIDLKPRTRPSQISQGIRLLWAFGAVFFRSQETGVLFW